MPKLSQTAFTDTMLRRIKPPSVREDRFDAIQRSLGLRIAPSGTLTWFLMRRLDGRMKRITIGRYPDVSLSEARKQAVNLLSDMASGKIPAKGSELSMSELVDRWLERDQVYKRTMDQKRQAMDRDVIPTLGRRPIASITKTDVRFVLDRIVGRGSPVSANRTYAYLRRMFSWAADNDYIEKSPITGLRRPSTENSRDRVLTKAELSAVWKAAGDLGFPFGDFFRLLILTGQRRSEVAGMRWNEVDPEKVEWVIPAERSKNGRAHLVHLPPLAADILTALANRCVRGIRADDLTADIFKNGNALIFTTTGTTPISGFSRAKRTLDESSGVTGWTIHDLRRTFATVTTGELGIEPVVVDKILNHVSGSLSPIAQVYMRHQYLPQRKTAMEKWAEYVCQLERD